MIVGSRRETLKISWIGISPLRNNFGFPPRNLQSVIRKAKKKLYYGLLGNQALTPPPPPPYTTPNPAEGLISSYTSAEAQFLVPDWGDDAGYVVGFCRTGPPALCCWAGRYEKPTPLLGSTPCQVLRIRLQKKNKFASHLWHVVTGPWINSWKKPHHVFISGWTYQNWELYWER
jgi:hypothetical protein